MLYSASSLYGTVVTLSLDHLKQVAIAVLHLVGVLPLSC